MALTRSRNPEVVAAGVARWLADVRGAARVEVIQAVQPSAGLSSETLLLDLLVDGDPESHAVRLPPLGPGLFPEYDLEVQAHAQRVVEEAGVPTAVPVDVVEDPAWVGSPFLVMPVVAGRVPGQVPALDDSILAASPDEQARLYDGVLEAVATVHQIDPTVADRVVPRRSLDAELAWWRRYLEWLADGEQVVPELDTALAWCVEHRPTSEPAPSLLWGDVRLGNVVIGGDWSPAALLDWEMTTIGAPEHDLAWWWGLEAVADELVGQRVPGFPTRDEARARYEALSGRALRDLGWYEVLALVRSTAILTRVDVLHERAGVPNPVPVAGSPILDLLAQRMADHG